MSRYGLNSLLYRVRTNAEYRQRFITEPDRVIADWDIAPEERTALKNWDVRRLNTMGVYLHILIGLSNILGSTRGSSDFKYDADQLSSAKANTTVSQ